jgi:hypothetical protein
MVNAVANQPEPNNSLVTKLENFKIADPQYVLSTDLTNPEDLENSILQNIGGHEIISLARRDLIDGKNINYSLVSGLKKLFQEYNPKTIISIQNGTPLYFNAFGIKFDLHLPSPQILNRIVPGLNNPVYLDENNNIIIYVTNIKDSYDVEVQSLNAKEVLRDTIYGEGNS